MPPVYPSWGWFLFYLTRHLLIPVSFIWRRMLSLFTTSPDIIQVWYQYKVLGGESLYFSLRLPFACTVPSYHTWYMLYIPSVLILIVLRSISNGRQSSAEILLQVRSFRTWVFSLTFSQGARAEGGRSAAFLFLTPDVLRVLRQICTWHFATMQYIVSYFLHTYSYSYNMVLIIVLRFHCCEHVLLL